VEVAGFFESLTEALDSGYEVFGLEAFLCKKIERKETVLSLRGGPILSDPFDLEAEPGPPPTLRSIHEGERLYVISEACKAEGEWRVLFSDGKRKVTYQVRSLDSRRDTFRVRKLSKTGKTKSAYVCCLPSQECECEGRRRGYRCVHLSMLQVLSDLGEF
jgi:hypothetical protein